MALLDQQTVVVAEVTAVAEADGHIVSTQFLHPDGSWHLTYPTGVPVGSYIGVKTTFRNDSAYVQSMDIFVTVTPPTAAPFDITGGAISVGPGVETEAMSTWIANEVGTWGATVSLGGTIA